MKSFLNILVALLLVIPIHASGNGWDDAQSLAKRHCHNPSLKKTGVKASSQLRSANVESPSYYIFSDDATNEFCIVTADGSKVLGYGDNYSDEMPPQLQAALDMYATSPQPVSELRSAKVRENIPAFMDVVYGTRSPYNIYIPERDGSGPPVGCVPVALAQICKYYEYPSHLLNDIPAYSHNSTANPDTAFYIEGQKAEGRTYDWSHILNHYEKDTTEVLNNEVAKLMWDCARSVETMFEQSGSSALTDMFFYSLIHYFGYNSDSLKTLSRALYYREDWLDIIHEELSKKRPIYMSGTSYTKGGHAFICDGYKDGCLHINWGWNGSNNGYFDVDILDYRRGMDREQIHPDNGYSFFEKIIIGIEPGNGTTEYKRPASSKNVVRPQIIVDSVGIDTRYRITENGYVMYTTVNIHESGAADSILYSIGYKDEKGNLLFWGDSRSGFFESDDIALIADRRIDASSLGREVEIYVLKSEKMKIETLAQDTMFEWWHVVEGVDPIKIRIPDSIAYGAEVVELNPIEFLGEYSDSTIVLNIGLTPIRPDGTMRYFSLALIVDGDTLMSETNTHVNNNSEDELEYKSVFKIPDIDKEMTLVMMQTDAYTRSRKLNKREWSVSENYKPVSFKLSDFTILSRELKVDTIVHSTKGTTQRFEITFTNPTPFEFYNDVYYLVDNEPSGSMVSIPAGESTTVIIEREKQVLTRYINGLLSVYNNFGVPAQFVYVKDTFSHVFYTLDAGDETTIGVQVFNGIDKDFENEFVLRTDSDTIAIQPVKIEPLDGALIKYVLPVFESDTTELYLKYTIYSVYDKDETLLGKVIPWDYRGRMQQTDVDGDILISIDLKPIIDTVMPPVLIGIASSIEDTSSYERLIYVPDSTDKAVSLDFWLGDYCKMKDPKYIGLCKKDGTFYAYMPLHNMRSNSSVDVPASTVSIIAVDGGVWISSDVDVPSLAIYNTEGKMVKTVGLKTKSAIFVPLAKGVYVVGGKKFVIRNS